MRKKIYLTKVKETPNALELFSEESISLQHLKSAGKMIVDSDELSFIYLAEDDQEYTYIYLPETVWEPLSRALKEQRIIEAVSDTSRLELVDIESELSYLVANIEGNSNYGDEMVSKVEAVFGSNS